MVLVRRKKEQEKEQEKDYKKESENKNISTEENKNTSEDLKRKIKTFHDQACLVLDILESQGVNIYDPNRKPGMYLKHGSTKRISSNLINKTDSSNEDSKSELKNKLSQLFKNKKS